VVIVHAGHYDTTRASLATFTRTAAGWVPAFAPMASRIGGRGFSDHHVEGVATTPVGVFGFGATMYGINPDPNVKYAYHRIVSGDWWNEASGSSRYNTFQHSSTDPGGASEALWQAHVAYKYFAFIAYNVPAVAGRGSGIFLHVGTGGPTAGCVSLAKSDLIEVLTWLNPSAHPRIVMATDSELKNL
jgi:L,D-peptidoglycan transpeptidase YkuD (ErfK/YbiS/YcfS/YnhG family)